jgi:hypothetical protein
MSGEVTQWGDGERATLCFAKGGLRDLVRFIGEIIIEAIAVE